MMPGIENFPARGRNDEIADRPHVVVVEGRVAMVTGARVGNRRGIALRLRRWDGRGGA